MNRLLIFNMDCKAVVYNTTLVKFSLLFCLAAQTPVTVADVPVYNFYTSSTFYHNQNTYPKINYPVHHKNQEKSSPQIQPSRNTESASPYYFVKAKSRASANNNPLPYTRDGALSAKLLEEFLENFARNSSRNATEAMRNMAQQNDLIQLMAGKIQLQGLDSGSIENHLALWHGQSWAIAHSKPLPTAQQYQAIAAQLRSQLEQSTYLKNMDNAKRQTFFERLAYPLFIQGAKYQGYLREGQSQKLSQEAANTQEGFKKMGLDLKKLQLTNRGLVPL